MRSGTSSSVSDVVYKAEQAKIRAARQQARRSPRTDAELIEGLRKLADGKSWWLEKHGTSGRWPLSDIEAKKRELSVLVQAADRLKIMGAEHEQSVAQA